MRSDKSSFFFGCIKTVNKNSKEASGRMMFQDGVVINGLLVIRRKLKILRTTE